MNIRVPVLYEDIELTDGEAMIAAFLAIICDQNGYDNYYVMNSYDFKKIYAKNPGSLRFDSRTLDTLRTHMHIVGLDEHNWALKFKWDKLYEIKMTRGYLKYPRTYKHKLKNPRSLTMWGYIMGKLHADREIISECTTDILPYKSSDRTLDRMWYENFKLDHYE